MGFPKGSPSFFISRPVVARFIESRSALAGCYHPAKKQEDDNIRPGASGGTGILACSVRRDA